MSLKVLPTKIVTAFSMITFSTTMAYLFPAVMYTDDYSFLGLKQLGPLFQSTWDMSQVNSPVYSVYIFFWLTSSIFMFQPIWFYLFFMSFCIWILITVTIVRISKTLDFPWTVLFPALFVTLFLLDRPSNQNIFWSVQAINSFVQHLIPILILTNWFLFRRIEKKLKTIFIDTIFVIVLFGFTGEIIIATIICLVVLLIQSKLREAHLIPLLWIGLLVVYLNLFSQGAKNRSLLLDRPDNLAEVMNRIEIFSSFLVKENSQVSLVFFLVSAGLGMFLKVEVPLEFLSRCLVLLIVLSVALCGVVVSAYQSTYHFVGLNMLIQLVMMFLGFNFSKFLISRINSEIKSEKSLKILISLLSLPIFVFISVSVSNNLVNTHSQSRAFVRYSIHLMSKVEPAAKIPVFTFRDSSNTGVIGPNIPAWKSFGLVSMDFADSGIQESINVLQRNSMQK